MQPEQQVTSFIRTCLSLFNLKDFERVLARMGIRSDKEECKNFLESNPNVFALTNNFYVTRAGAFTNQYFCIKPTSYEYDKGVFVVGDRCMPFVDTDVFSSSLKFVFKDNIIPQKNVEVDSNFALSVFSLFGDEFATQYIASDPANSDLNIADACFSLPAKVHLTGFSIDLFKKYCNFKKGDRLICHVTNWDNGIIEVEPEIREANNSTILAEDLERQTWYENLENTLLSGFDILGPCSSIEEQLALAFVDNPKQLCIRNCGTVEEFLLKSKKVGFEAFGVETRLWRKDEDIPAIGDWNSTILGGGLQDEKMNPTDVTLPDYVIDACIENQLFAKKWNPGELIKDLFPNEALLDLKFITLFRLHLESRHDIILRHYNWFADFQIGDIRSKAMALYFKVSTLVSKIDKVNTDLSNFPQQELVILSQIFSHLCRIIEIIEEDTSAAIEQKNEIGLSVEGMELNFECISEEIVCVIDDFYKKNFEVTK